MIRTDSRTIPWKVTCLRCQVTFEGDDRLEVSDRVYLHEMRVHAPRARLRILDFDDRDERELD